MADLTTVLLGVIQIMVQLGAVYLAYRLTRSTGIFTGWTLFIIALMLMTARRVTALMIEIGSIGAPVGIIAFTDRILLPLAISVLLALAMYDLVRTFERQRKKQPQHSSFPRAHPN
jgi:hypothetical protein